MCTQPNFLQSIVIRQTNLVHFYVYAYAILTPISHPGCMTKPFVWPSAASASAGELKIIENAFAPGLVPAGGRGAADAYPGYLPLVLWIVTKYGYKGTRCEKRAPMMASVHSGGKFVQTNFVPEDREAAGASVHISEGTMTIHGPCEITHHHHPRPSPFPPHPHPHPKSLLFSQPYLPLPHLPNPSFDPMRLVHPHPPFPFPKLRILPELGRRQVWQLVLLLRLVIGKDRYVLMSHLMVSSSS